MKPKQISPAFAVQQMAQAITEYQEPRVRLTRRHSVHPNKGFNDPAAFFTLSIAERLQLLCWIWNRFEPSKRIYRGAFVSTSYGIKHEFANSSQGFYVTNGQFKGAMLTAGFTPVDPDALNWTFRMVEKKPFGEMIRERHSRGYRRG